MRIRDETIAGVEFGSRAVRVLIAQRDDEGDIHVIGHGTAPSRGCVQRGVVQDLSAAQVAFKRAMTAAEKEAGTRVQSVFCGINGCNVETFIGEGNAKLDQDIVERHHMKDVLDIASRQVLSPGKHVTAAVTAREWYVDDLRVREPTDIRGHVLKVRIHFAQLPAVIVDNLCTCIESQKRSVEGLVFIPLAAALACLTPEDMELGAALLDIGHSTTGLAVYRNHRILDTQAFEWGGNDIARDVAAGLQVSFEEADDLVLEYGVSENLIRSGVDNYDEEDAEQAVSPSGRIKLRNAVRGAPHTVERGKLDKIIYLRAGEMLTKIRQHLKENGEMDRQLVRGMVFTGGGAALKNILALGEDVFDVPCRVGAPDGFKILPHEVTEPEFSGVSGIIRHGFAYRDAARAGRLESRGIIGATTYKVAQLIRKYFF